MAWRRATARSRAGPSSRKSASQRAESEASAAVMGPQDTLRAPSPHRVQAPHSRARGRVVQPEEAEEHGGRALVLNRPQTVWLVELEIRHRHLARENEGDQPGEATEEHERPA